jgi:hypothetical protein
MTLSIGEGPKYRPFSAFRSVLEASKPREQVKNHGRDCTKVLFLRKTNRAGWYLPLVRRSQYSLACSFRCRRSCVLKTGFFRQEKSRQCFTLTSEVEDQVF